MSKAFLQLGLVSWFFVTYVTINSKAADGCTLAVVLSLIGSSQALVLYLVVCSPLLLPYILGLKKAKLL